MKAPKPSGLSFETSEAGYKTKFFIVQQSRELISKMQFTFENNLYIYHGSQGTDQFLKTAFFIRSSTMKCSNTLFLLTLFV